MDRVYLARQMNRAFQIFANGMELSDDVKMQIADLYPAWNGDSTRYLVGDVVKYGVNADGETQLYEVVQGHTSQADWTPDVAVSLFKKIGFTDEGLPVWTQPLGAGDAYQTGDRVSHNGVVYTSKIDNNVWSPEAYPAGWEAS
ncbi:hypothetical protein FACS1894171_2520 [Clostridia bacterium]|nr:hypothetical protein FACS1894171_2520 [Clostridia bacterium]